VIGDFNHQSLITNYLSKGNYSGHSAFHHEDHKEITKCAKIAGFLPFFVIFAPSLRSLWLKAEQLQAKHVEL
jgi:hypothetical protein